MIEKESSCKCGCHPALEKCDTCCEKNQAWKFHPSIMKSFAESIDKNIVNHSFSKEDEELIKGLSQCSNTPMSLYKFLCDWRYMVLTLENRVKSVEGKWGNAFTDSLKAELNERIVAIEKGLKNYREYRTSIEDLETDVMYLKERVNKLESDHLDQLNPHAFIILKKQIEELEEITSKREVGYIERIGILGKCLHRQSEEMNRLSKVHPDYFLPQISSIVSRLEILEGHICFNKDNRHDLNQALSAIQAEYKQMFGELHQQINTYNEIVLGQCPIEIEKLNRKIPHKCPLCNGFGSKMIKSEECAEAPRRHFLENNPCHGCNGFGMVWEPALHNESHKDQMSKPFIYNKEMEK